MATNPLVPQGQAYQNFLKFRTDVQGDKNFQQGIDDYKGGFDSWWLRHGKQNYGADVLSGATFLKEPGDVFSTDQMSRLFQIRPDVKRVYGSDMDKVSSWLKRYGTQELTPQQQEMVKYGMSRPKDFEFDAEEYLPQIQKMASAIYDPQQMQLQAMRQLQQSKYKQQKVTTAEEFEKLLKQEEEAYNRRGAFFSTGALEKSSRILEQKGRSLAQLDIQNMANQAQLMAQQGMLSAQQAEYIQGQLTNRESGAYARYRDKMSDYYKERDYYYSTKRDAREDYYRERDWLYTQYRDERDYYTDYYQWRKSYKLQKEQLKKS